jgi:hypothetical protein
LPSSLIVEIVSVALDLLHATPPLNHGAFLKQARGLGFLFCGCFVFVWFFPSGVLVVLSILVCMIHHEGEKQVSKQAKQMGHHYLQMGGAHCTTSSYPVPKFLDLIIGSLLLLPLEDLLSRYIFVQLHFVHLPLSPCCWKISNNRTLWCRVVYK